MKDFSMFLSYFFEVTGFQRHDIYSVRHASINKRYILISCLYQLGYTKSEISRLMNKSFHCILDALEKIKEGDKEYAKRIVTRWNEKMREMPSDITSF